MWLDVSALVGEMFSCRKLLKFRAFLFCTNCFNVLSSLLQELLIYVFSVGVFKENVRYFIEIELNLGTYFFSCNLHY